MSWFFSYLVVGAFVIVASSLRAYFKRASVLAKQRAKIVFFGAAIAFPVPAFVLLWSIPFGGSLGRLGVLENFLAIPVIIFPASISYAIAKHNLFDVDVYIKRAVGYVLMTVIVGMAFISIQTVIRTTILNPIFGEAAEQVYPILFALLIVFLFNPINRKVQGGVDKLFFRKQYDYKETIRAVSNALTSMLNLDQIIEQVSRTVRKEMFVDTAGVVVLEQQKKTWQTLFVGDGPKPGEEFSKLVHIGYDDPLLALVGEEKRLITRYDLEEDARYGDVKELCLQSFSEMGASIAIPLIYQDQVTGVLALGYKKSGHFYTREDVDLLTTLADQGAVAIENARLFKENLEKVRMEEELKIAHDIQASMLPERAPEIEGFTIAARSIPAREVGGDFYDFIEMGGDGAGDDLAIVIGDVSGKGVSAALLMSASRSTYRVLVQGRPSVEELMNGANQRLNRDIKKGMFVALLYAVLDPREKTLKLSNAGQTKPIISSGERSEPLLIDTEGDRFPLGIVTDCHYEETRVPLQDRDAVVFYTDGVVEALNDKGEMYGFERLMTSIEAGRELGANALLEKLMDDVLRYVGDVEQHDDLTMVVVKVG